MLTDVQRFKDTTKTFSGWCLGEVILPHQSFLMLLVTVVSLSASIEGVDLDVGDRSRKLAVIPVPLRCFQLSATHAANRCP